MSWIWLGLVTWICGADVSHVIDWGPVPVDSWPKGVNLESIVNLETPESHLTICLEERRSFDVPGLDDTLTVQSPKSCIDVSVDEATKSVSCTWPISMYFKGQSRTHTIVQTVQGDYVSASLTHHTSGGCFPSCSEHGFCRMGEKRNQRIFWCACEYGWAGRGCVVEYRRALMRRVSTLLLLLSNIGCFISVYLLSRCYLMIKARWRRCRSISKSVVSALKPDVGQRWLILIGILIVFLLGWFSAIYHLCDHNKICFLDKGDGTAETNEAAEPISRSTSVLPSMAVPGSFGSSMFFSCMKDKVKAGLFHVESISTLSSECQDVISRYRGYVPAVSIAFYSQELPLRNDDIDPTDPFIKGYRFNQRFQLLQDLDYTFALLACVHLALQCSHLPLLITAPLLCWSAALIWKIVHVPPEVDRARPILLILLAASCFVIGGLAYKILYEYAIESSIGRRKIWAIKDHATCITFLGAARSSVALTSTSTMADPDDASDAKTASGWRRYWAIGWPRPQYLIPTFVLFAGAITGWALAITASGPGHVSFYWAWHSLWHICIETIPGVMVSATVQHASEDERTGAEF